MSKKKKLEKMQKDMEELENQIKEEKQKELEQLQHLEEQQEEEAFTDDPTEDMDKGEVLDDASIELKKDLQDLGAKYTLSLYEIFGLLEAYKLEITRR